MSITFKEDTTVFEDGSLIGRIESEEGYQPVFYPITKHFLSIDAVDAILDKMKELD